MGRPLKRHKDVSPRRASEKVGKVLIFACILLMNEGNHSFLCGNIARKMRVATWLKYEVTPTVFFCECFFHIQQKSYPCTEYQIYIQLGCQPVFLLEGGGVCFFHVDGAQSSKSHVRDHRSCGKCMGSKHLRVISWNL